MRQRLLFLVAALALARLGDAQQLLCERVLTWPATQNGFVAIDLLQPRPDSLRLLGDYQVSGTHGPYLPTVTRLRRLQVGSCDTLPVRNAAFATQAIYGITNFSTGTALLTRQRTTLVAHGFSQSGTAYQPTELRLLDRAGQVRRTTYLPTPSTNNDLVTDMVEAPDKGFFITTLTDEVAQLIRTDSLGNVLWRRRVGKDKNFRHLHAASYGGADNLRFLTMYVSGGRSTVGVLELNQNGDSLRLRPINPDPTQRSDAYTRRASQPLRDGGLLITARLDSAGTGYYRPFLVRLDANLNVLWSSVYRSQAVWEYQFSSPFELADGSLLVLAYPANQFISGSVGSTYHLFHYSVAGALLQRYTFTSPAIMALKQGGTYGSYGPQFIEPAGLQPLSDSTFMLVDNLYAYRNNRQVSLTYLAHLKVPGLRRVIDSHYIPAANSPLAALPAGADWPAPAYPNPARMVVAVPLPAGVPAARLVLLDALGRQVRTQVVAAGARQADLAVAGVGPGLYLLRLEAPGWSGRAQRLAIEP